MNRNMMCGRGRGGASNSFASSHLLNLDTKMELLQRKREALQYEHQRLHTERANMRKRPYESDVPSQSLPYYQTQSTVQNFAHLYDGGSEGSFGGTLPKRRPQVNVWDDTRFNVNQSSVPQRHAPYVGPIPQNRAQPMPLLGIAPKPVGRRILDMPPKSGKSKFYTTTQFNAAPPPMHMKKKHVQKLPVLRPNEQPSKQLNGRLGLALGLIIKKMKEEYCTSEETTNLFHSKHMQRYMRKTIRERLGSIMLNRAVGKPDDVLAAYRKVFPAHTDKHILDNANVNADFDKFLRFNISRIMSEKLDELFEKMKQLCEGKVVEVTKLIKPLVSSSAEEKTEINKDVILTQDYLNSLTTALIEENLPQILPKYTQNIIKMLDLDTEINNYIDKNMKGMKAPINNKSVPTNSKVPDDGDDEAVVIGDDGNDDDTIEISEDNTPDEPDNDVTPENGDLDKTIEDQKSTESTDKSEPMELATPKSQQYFVKVLGQPSLPNRADAYKFFTSLNAVTIKKHKVIQNLLVVGFNTEEDYEKAVAASDTVVGNCKLIIKTNDKQALSTTTTPYKEKAECEKTEVMLTPDLENEITDLLSKIKQEQPESMTNTETSDTEQSNTEQTNAEQNNTEQCNSEQNNTEQTSQEQSNTEQSDDGSAIVEQSDSKVIDEVIKEENVITNSEANGDEKTEKPEDNKSTPTKELDDTKNLDTIQEVDETKVEPIPNVANVKNVTGKSTPMKTRQSVATPRTIRTRRSSKLEQLNN